MKRFKRRMAAFGAALMMVSGCFSLGASALSSKSSSVSKTNSYYTDSMSNTFDGRNTLLNIGYYYGASKSGKADLICTYGYNTVLGYKYAEISYGSKKYSTSGVTNKTTNQITKTLSVNSSSALVYSGYTKADKNDTVKKYKMTYTLTVK
ncbi:MAG: hypothetical protein LUI06_06285 [Ruminococcus sp.]|nr:hypothetical protein [Ruminococcus sp.]